MATTRSMLRNKGLFFQTRKSWCSTKCKSLKKCFVIFACSSIAAISNSWTPAVVYYLSSFPKINLYHWISCFLGLSCLMLLVQSDPFSSDALFLLSHSPCLYHRWMMRCKAERKEWRFSRAHLLVCLLLIEGCRPSPSGPSDVSMRCNQKVFFLS